MCSRYLNVCADFGIIVPFLPKIALILKMHLTITKRAYPKHISVLDQPSHLVFLRRPFFLKAFPNTTFDSPLNLPAARSAFSQCPGDFQGDPLLLWWRSARVFLKLCNFLWTGHFTTRWRRSRGGPGPAETVGGMCRTN